MEQLVQDKGLQNVYSAKSGRVTIHLDIDKMILTIKVNWFIFNDEIQFDLSNGFKKVKIYKSEDYQ